MQVALIGLRQSGKSTLFSALTGVPLDSTGGQATQGERAVIKVPDERLEVLTKMYQPKKTTPASIDFLDMPGLSFVDEGHRQEARRLIAQARQVDMLVLVLCDFSNESVAAYRSRVDPVADLAELQSECLLADLEQIENRIAKLEASAHKPSKTQDADKKELALLQNCREAIESEQPLSSVIDKDEDEKAIRSFGFLTLKPFLVVANVSEDKANEGGALPEAKAGGPVLSLCAMLEAELSALDEDDRAVFLEDMGLTEIARNRLIRQCYQTCSLFSFLTVGPDEVRAWSVPSNCPAVEAAGEIHSDIQRGFIRAEVVAYDDLLAAGDMKGAKAAGKTRLEGKTYPVQDGDIINFRFNV
jgi:hypothetical protein